MHPAAGRDRLARAADRDVVAADLVALRQIHQGHLVAFRDPFAQHQAGTRDARRQHRAGGEAARVGDDRDVVGRIDPERQRRLQRLQLGHSTWCPVIRLGSQVENAGT